MAECGPDWTIVEVGALALLDAGAVTLLAVHLDLVRPRADLDARAAAHGAGLPIAPALPDAIDGAAMHAAILVDHGIAFAIQLGSGGLLGLGALARSCAVAAGLRTMAPLAPITPLAEYGAQAVAVARLLHLGVALVAASAALLGLSFNASTSLLPAAPAGLRARRPILPQAPLAIDWAVLRVAVPLLVCYPGASHSVVACLRHFVPVPRSLPSAAMLGATRPRCPFGPLAIDGARLHAARLFLYPAAGARAPSPPAVVEDVARAEHHPAAASPRAPAPPAPFVPCAVHLAAPNVAFSLLFIRTRAVGSAAAPSHRNDSVPVHHAAVAGGSARRPVLPILPYAVHVTLRAMMSWRRLLRIRPPAPHLLQHLLLPGPT
mmetsp:Transcript_47579/g.120879  ORF Transcript_47579/g.120879 Transcript_47579/m.120879 type:complete len:377 (-) Transcript_47579:46-1176(-)